MSEDKFSVPVKIPVEKNSTTKKSSTAKTQAKTSQNNKSVKTGAKTTSTKTNKITENKETKAKSSTVSKRKENPALDAIPDMSLLSAKERHDLVLGKPKEVKKVEKKEEKKSERSVKLDTIKKVQTEVKSHEAIPKLGERKKVRSYPIIPLIWALIIILILLFLTLTLKFAKKDKMETVVPAVSSLENIDEVVLNIEKGMSAFQVASQLSPILDTEAFLSELTARGLTGSIQVGKYKISRGSSIDEIIFAITQKSNMIKIYEGQDIAAIDTMLYNKGLIKKNEFIKACDEIKKMENLPFAEGWFLSGSYKESSKELASMLAKDMHTALLEYIKVNSEAFNNSEYSISELLIIASMVQRETQDESQMPLIASVIFNRLKEDMPLGIDATTRYELNDWKNEIKQSVYDKITPYNTRRQKGLPPTGIGCVSEKALDAVLNPAVTDYLYYRHGSDGDLYLSHSYDEHLSNAQVAQKK